jgi:hypothetical protein
MDFSRSGAPRYLEGRFYPWKPRIISIFIWITTEVLKKKILDFVRFIIVPDASYPSSL